MSRLIKNELIKLLHKKEIYIYMVIIFIIFGASVFINLKFNKELKSGGGLNNSYYEYLENEIKNYDLSDPTMLESYVGDKTDLDVHKIIQEKGIQDYYSSEYYYVDNKVREGVYELNSAKYIYKDEEKIKEAEENLDELLKDIKSTSWRDDLKEEKEILEELLKNVTSDKDKAMIEDEILAIDYRLKNDIPFSYANGSLLIEEFIGCSKSYYEIDKDKETKTHQEKMNNMEIEKNYFISKYKLENDIVETDEEIISFADSFTYAQFEIIIAILIIMGGIVAEEFNKGTVKQLFVRPYKRWKILLGKMIAGLIVLLGFFIFYQTLSLVSSLLIGVKVSSLKSPIIVYSFTKGKVITFNLATYALISFIATLPEYLFYATICFLVGIVTTSTAAAIVATLAVQLIPAMVTFTEKVEACLPYNCLNFNQYLFGGITQNKYQTFTSSLIVWIITMIILNSLMFWVFAKKDVKNQ